MQLNILMIELLKYWAIGRGSLSRDIRAETCYLIGYASYVGVHALGR
jgi:hypothetical protein